MRLVTSTRDLVMGGRPYPGFPILLWETMDSCTPVNQFLRHYGAITSSAIEDLVREAMSAVGHELYRRWSFPVAHHSSLSDYINWRVSRYKNEELRDSIGRVCRDPLRTLGRDDRLVGPVNYVQRYSLPSRAADAVGHVLIGTAAAMKYSVDTGESGGSLAELCSKVQRELQVDSSLLAAAEKRFSDFRAASARLASSSSTRSTRT